MLTSKLKWATLANTNTKTHHVCKKNRFCCVQKHVTHRKIVLDTKGKAPQNEVLFFVWFLLCRGEVVRMLPSTLSTQNNLVVGRVACSRRLTGGWYPPLQIANERRLPVFNTGCKSDYLIINTQEPGAISTWPVASTPLSSGNVSFSPRTSSLPFRHIVRERMPVLPVKA